MSTEANRLKILAGDDKFIVHVDRLLRVAQSEVSDKMYTSGNRYVIIIYGRSGPLQSSSPPE